MEKALVCGCGVELVAESDEELLTLVEQHVALDHPDAVDRTAGPGAASEGRLS